jgi:hypothetical protein
MSGRQPMRDEATRSTTTVGTGILKLPPLSIDATYAMRSRILRECRAYR